MIAPARNKKAIPQMVRILRRWEVPTSSSISNSPTDSPGLMGAMATVSRDRQERRAFFGKYCEGLPARRHFRSGHGLQVRLLQHGIGVGQILVLKVGPTCQRFFRRLVPLLVRRYGVSCGSHIRALHDAKQAVES